MDIMVRSVILFLKLSMLFVPQQRYEEKIAQIVVPELKNEGTNLKGWEFKSVVSPQDSLVHYYYRYPSRQADAPVFLFIHGLNLDGRTFLNLDSLSRHWELIAYDLPENTPRYQGHFSDFIGIVEEFIGLMEFKSCCLAGVSFGGGIALHLAAQHPDIAAEGLTLISTGIVGSSKKQQSRNQKLSDWVSTMPDYKLYWFMEKMYARSAKGIARDTTFDIHAMLRVKHPAFYRQVARSLSTFNAIEDARKVRCPVLVLFGDKDRLFSRKQAEDIRTHIPQAQVEIIPDGTHGMVYLRGDEIAGHIVNFAHTTRALDGQASR